MFGRQILTDGEISEFIRVESDLTWFICGHLTSNKGADLSNLKFYNQNPSSFFLVR